MNELTHLSLFSGIGGLDLAAELAGFTTVGQCEMADYPTKVLEKHWPDVPRWRDIRTLTGESFYERTGLRAIDVISGGFPCQPFSCAGKQRGKEDDRYLWPQMLRVIKELRPSWIVGENVAGIVKMALHDILSELENCGYSTRAFLIPACAVGARHRRYRVAIIGAKNLENSGRGGCVESENVCEQPWGAKFERAGQIVSDPVDNTSGHATGLYGFANGGDFFRAKKERSGQFGWEPKPLLDGVDYGISDRVDGDLSFIVDHYWDTEPDVPRISVDKSNRIDRIKCLGNAVVPQQFYPVFKAIADIERGYTA